MVVEGKRVGTFAGSDPFAFSVPNRNAAVDCGTISLPSDDIVLVAQVPELTGHHNLIVAAARAVGIKGRIAMFYSACLEDA